LFGSSNAAISIRSKLINEDLLHGVILLPQNIYKPYAAVSTALLLINNTRQSKSTGVFLYDASSVPLNEFEKEIDNIVTSFHSEKSIRDKARWVQKIEFENRGYDLSVKKYLLKSLEGEEYVLLQDLLEEYFIGNHVSSDNINKDEGLPYIQVGDLIEGEGLETIHTDKLKSFISDIELVRSSIKEIPAGSILISKVGTKLKPTLFEGNFLAVASSNIIVLKPCTNILSEYLISQLQSEYVQKQIDVIRRYNAIPNFNLKELLKVQVKKLSLEQQHQYVTTYYSRKVSDIEKAETKIREDELYNLISRIKHEVKQPISSIGIDISILKEYLTDKEIEGLPISLRDYVVEGLPGQNSDDLEFTKVENLLNRIIGCVEDAQNTLTKAEETLNIGKGVLKLEQVEIKDFIETVIRPLYINANFLIQVKGKEISIRADKYQLKIMFKHLIENALKHGFIKNRPKEENIIKIELDKQLQGSFLEIVVMNNGEPPDIGFNKTIFETKGITSNRNTGSGFGGYHIKRIIENHKGELEVADKDEVLFTDFKMKFKIYLPFNL